MRKNFLLDHTFETIDEQLIYSKYSAQNNSSFEGLIGLEIFFKENKGKSYLNGLFKIHHEISARYWNNKIKQYFNKINFNYFCFGFDWLGRQYALSCFKSKQKILMFDSATMEFYELEGSLEDFFQIDLVDYLEETLSLDTFNLWIKNNPSPNFFECISFKIPLAVNGDEGINNYHLVDIKTSWEFNKLVFDKIKELPEGTKIDWVTFMK